jgi:hypothetical protein
MVEHALQIKGDKRNAFVKKASMVKTVKSTSELKQRLQLRLAQSNDIVSKKLQINFKSKIFPIKSEICPFTT